MKKLTISLILFLLFFTNIVNVYAYDGLNYKIDIPESYKKQNNKNLWTFTSDDYMTSLSIAVISNNSNVDINNMNKESLDEALLKELNKSLNTQEEVDVRTSNLSLVKIKDYNAIKINIESSMKSEDEFVSTVYQLQYIFSSKNHLYYLVFSSSDKNKLSNNDINSIINSFTIKDDLEIGNKSGLKEYYITLSIIVLSGTIIMLMTKNNKLVKFIRKDM